MKSIRKKVLLATSIVYLMVLSLNVHAIGLGCEANDPGECSRECSDGLACCVGLSPNCTSGFDKPAQKFYIDCGQGKEWCGNSNNNED